MIPSLLLGLSLAWIVLRGGGVHVADLWPSAAAFGAIACAVSRLGPSPALGRDARRFAVAFALMAVVAAVQLIPLPVALLDTLSPRRAEAVRAAAEWAGGSMTASLSAAPGTTLEFLLLIAAMLTVAAATWTIASRGGRDPWLVVAPLVLLAVLEAALGLWQAVPGGSEAGVRGTYVNRNHFAAFLCAAPPLLFARAVLDFRSGERGRLSIGLSGAALLLIAAAVLHSVSRTGLLTLAVSILWTGSLIFPRRAAVVATIGVAAITAMAMMAPEQLAMRLGSGELSGRLAFWSETVNLIRNYPIVGCGLGAFEFAIYPWRHASAALTLDYAHNDFLQLGAEAGVAALPIAIITAIALLAAAWRQTRSSRSAGHCHLAAGCGGALVAFCLFSVFDSNLRIPANAISAAWIAGMVAGLESRARAG